MMTAALELEAISAWHEMALPKALEMQSAANIAIQWAEELEDLIAPNASFSREP